MVARMDELSPEGDFSLRLAPFATWMLADWSIAPQFTTAVKLNGQLDCPEAPSFAEKGSQSLSSGRVPWNCAGTNLPRNSNATKSLQMLSLGRIADQFRAEGYD